jgi:hypothetical protein
MGFIEFVGFFEFIGFFGFIEFIEFIEFLTPGAPWGSTCLNGSKYITQAQTGQALYDDSR